MAAAPPATDVSTDSGDDRSRSFTPEEARALVDECFALYKSKLTETARTSLEMCGDLFESASHIPDGEVAMFRAKRADWLDRYIKMIEQLYAKRLAGERRKGRRPDYDASLATLKVLTAFDHEKQSALIASTAFLMRFTRREMDALDLRFDALLPDKSTRSFDNPFAPEYVLDAFGAASRAVYPDPRIWRPLMERLLGDLTPAINKIYISLNRFLADRGVLPEIKAALRARSSLRPADDRDLLPAFSRMLAESGDEVIPEVVVPEAFGAPGEPPALKFTEKIGQPPSAPTAAPAPGVPPGGLPASAPAAEAPADQPRVPSVNPFRPWEPAKPGVVTPPTQDAGYTGPDVIREVKPGQMLPAPAILAGLAALARLGTSGVLNESDAALAAKIAPAALGTPIGGAPAVAHPPARALADGEFPDVDPMLALGTSTPLFNTLAVWQRLDLPSAIASAIPAPAGGPIDAAAVPLNLIPHIRTAVADKIASPTDRITMDVIALLFDYIFRDPSIPVEMRNLFGRLEVPILKAALLDRTFFSDRKHPARRLLDHLAEAAVGATNVPAYRDAFAELARNLVDDVCRDFEIDLSVIETADKKLKHFMETERHDTESALDRDVATALREEQDEHDRAEVRALVRDRLAGLTLPFAVRAFAETTWSDYVTGLRKAHGVVSDAVQAALRTLDDMLWSILVKERSGQKARLTKMIPGLVGGLKAGCQAMQVSGDRSKAFFDELYELHMAAIKPRVEGAPAPAPEVQPAAVANVHDYVSEMAPGTWVRFTMPEGEPVSARLSWISPLRTKYIFTSRGRSTALVYAPEELAWELGAGRATLIVEPVALFDRAVSAALDTLAEQKQAVDAADAVPAGA
jgi:hypothetical protein